MDMTIHGRYYFAVVLTLTVFMGTIFVAHDMFGSEIFALAVGTGAGAAVALLLRSWLGYEEPEIE
ncbi:MAG: hypothetical protein AAFR81_18145 [Chloroflexota bacterium]